MIIKKKQFFYNNLQENTGHLITHYVIPLSYFSH
nr:MAG TPA: hypothetical protein [Caudoviricetes sp.]